MREKILRYTQLVLRHQRLGKQNESISQTELDELEQLKAQLGLSHDEIIEKASKSIIDGPFEH